MSELRWNPLLREWVITATARQERTYLPSAAQCPLCPTRDPRAPTEIPRPNFDIAVFENRFPALRRQRSGVSVGLGMMPRLLRAAAARVRRASRVRVPRR